MVGFNSVQNRGKWLDFSIKNSLKTLLFATREFLILLLDNDEVIGKLQGVPKKVKFAFQSRQSNCQSWTLQVGFAAQRNIGTSPPVLRSRKHSVAN